MVTEPSNVHVVELDLVADGDVDDTSLTQGAATTQEPGITEGK